MSDESILTQDEVDALLNNVGDDDKDDDDGLIVSGRKVEVRDYDLVSGDRIVRGQFPILNVINQRLGRLFRTSLSRYIHSEVSVTPTGVDISRYSDYIYTLYVPTSVHMVAMAPLQGEAMVVLDAKFIYEIVDQFFGGGRQRVKMEGREFSITELRVIERLYEFIAEALVECWDPVLPITVSQAGHEVNPSLVNLVRANEVVVVSSFDVVFDSGRGTLQIAMPYSMLEPYQDVIEDAVKKEDEDPHWRSKLEARLLQARVPLNCLIGSRTINMGDILGFKAGDFIPLEVPEVHTVTTGGVPAMRARLGAANGNMALEYEDDRVD